MESEIATEMVANSDTTTSQPPSATEDPADNRITFLTLPKEIRLAVYEELLIWRSIQRHPEDEPARGTQLRVFIHERTPYTGFVQGRIMRTCKQVNDEARSILYGRNTFYVDEPTNLIRFCQRVGSTNFQLIKDMRLYVTMLPDLTVWLQLLHTLATEGRLRRLHIIWTADDLYPGDSSPIGLGDNIEFVRALAKIQGLDKMTIEGFYASKWPAYLEEQMGVRVEAVPGGHHLNWKSRSRLIASLKLGIPGWRACSEATIQDAVDQAAARKFELYQQGTEDLTP